MTKKERIILVLLASLNFTHMLDFMIMMPLANYLMPYFDISPKQFSFLLASYTLSAAVSGFIVAFFVDNYDRKKVLLFGYIGFLAGTIACGFAPGYVWLLSFRIFTGIFGGLIGAQVMAIVGDLFKYEKRGTATGAVMSSFAIATTIGVPFALYLSNIFSWHAPFLLTGFAGIVLIPLVIKHIPAMRDHLAFKNKEAHPMQALFHVVKNRTQVLTLIFSVLIMTGHFLIIPFANPFLEFNKGFSKDLTPLVYLVGGIVSFASAIMLGKLSDRIGKFQIFALSVILSCAVIWVITSLPDLAFSLVLCIFAFWFIVGTSRAVTAQAMITNVVTQEKRGSFMSFNSSMQQLGTGIASLIAGFIVIEDKSGKIQHYDKVGYLSIIVLLVSLLLGRYLFAGMDKKETHISKEEKLIV